MTTKVTKIMNIANNFSLWKRIWISISILFFLWIEFYATNYVVDETIYTAIFVRAPLVSLAFSILLFILCLLTSWTIKGFKDVELGEFSKFTIKLMILTLFSLVIYYVASPYQNCLRNKSGSEQYVVNFCTSQTSW